MLANTTVKIIDPAFTEIQPDKGFIVNDLIEIFRVNLHLNLHISAFLLCTRGHC